MSSAKMPPRDEILLDYICSSHFESFGARVFNHIYPGTRYLPNWHIAALHHHLQEVGKGIFNRLIVAMPPRSGKSAGENGRMAWIPTTICRCVANGGILCSIPGSRSRHILARRTPVPRLANPPEPGLHDQSFPYRTEARAAAKRLQNRSSTAHSMPCLAFATIRLTNRDRENNVVSGIGSTERSKNMGMRYDPRSKPQLPPQL